MLTRFNILVNVSIPCHPKHCSLCEDPHRAVSTRSIRRSPHPARRRHMHSSTSCDHSQRTVSGRSETATEAAVRELREELGDDRIDVEILGQLPTVPGKNGKAVSPILGFLPEVDLTALEQTRSTAEVEAIFTVPLFPTLANPEFEMYREYELPVYHTPEARGVKIWGLTAFVMHGVMKDIIVPALRSQ